jgi:hypothetical protein
LRTGDFTINGVISGLLLFKSLLIHSKVNAVNDPSLIKRNTTKALELMRSLNHDVRKFNIAYRGLDQQLSVCGQVFADGKTFIEEAYLDHPNEHIIRFIQMLQDRDRMSPPGKTGDQLMDEGQAKIEQIEQAEQHRTMENSKQDEVVALKAQVDTLTKAVNKFKKANKAANKSTDNTDSSGANSNNNGGKREHKGKKDPNAKPFPEELKKALRPDDPSVP